MSDTALCPLCGQSEPHTHLDPGLPASWLVDEAEEAEAFEPLPPDTVWIITDLGSEDPDAVPADRVGA